MDEEIKELNESNLKIEADMMKLQTQVKKKKKEEGREEAVREGMEERRRQESNELSLGNRSPKWREHIELLNPMIKNKLIRHPWWRSG